MVPRETQPLKLQRAERNNALSLKGRFACYPPLVALREAHFEVCWQTGLVTRELWGGGLATPRPPTEHPGSSCGVTPYDSLRVPHGRSWTERDMDLCS